ncbi:MAG: aminopeptidase [Candidatus Euphemobacter frigidus]|nr:aminopeptidase [Candidatus Euphemobacter frigidus]MDP8276350.1 aminopeptidase [Candidatus Euphemobacter frigidus]
MKDRRQVRLARILVDYSAEVKKGDIVLVEYSDGTPLEFIREIQTACLERGAKYVKLNYANSDLAFNFYRRAHPQQLHYFPVHELQFMKSVNAYIGVGSPWNNKTLSAIPGEILSARQRLLKPIQARRVDHTRWVITRYPTHSQAQDAGMSFEDFEDFYFRACNIDWRKESSRQQKLKLLLGRTKTVRLVAPDTDITLSIVGMPAIKCDGKRNMPDGEVFTAPLLHSAEGHIRYNVPSLYQGKFFSGVYFEFKKGKIVAARADQGEEHLETLLNTDRGARFIGEFAFGLNKKIRRPILSTLFDEKIAGSIHLTPGKAYRECDNGNSSAIHWDLVRIMKDGEIYLDGKLVQKGGKFVLPELKPLN